MEKERVEEILKSSKHIRFNGWIKPNEYGFCRTCSFSVRGVEYEIEWYCNYSELRCGEMLVLFDNFRTENTWPHYYKDNLQFYRNGNVCAVIPIEEYSEQEVSA